jgi:hypothetical protein
MKNLRRLSATVILILALGLSVFAGEILTPPCAAPGEILTPPCTTSPGDSYGSGTHSTAPGDLSTPVANNETSFADFAADLLLNFLPLY